MECYKTPGGVAGSSPTGRVVERLVARHSRLAGDGGTGGAVADPPLSSCPPRAATAAPPTRLAPQRHQHSLERGSALPDFAEQRAGSLRLALQIHGSVASGRTAVASFPRRYSLAAALALSTLHTAATAVAAVWGGSGDPSAERAPTLPTQLAEL
jgi:hypothetical protein